ncbi:hypothetical protein ACFU5Y_00500 [Streptomyces gardneri]|uniref:hypothetical protein n=1 Tax=Streptomyces gardneri TaxID=66892 RepID=UPI0036974641
MPARAVHDQGPVRGQFVRTPREFAEPDVQGGLDEAVRLALAAGALVDHGGRTARTEGGAAGAWR